MSVQVYYVVDKASWGGLAWKGGVGYVTKDMVRRAAGDRWVQGLLQGLGL